MMNLTTLPLSFWDYALESATRILNMVTTKKVDKTPYELWYAEFFEKKFITQEVSGRAVDLEEIQDEDASPSEITSKIPMEVEGFEPPQEEVIPIRRSVRTHRAPDRLCLNVEVEEHSLGDLNEPASYKAAIAIRILISIVTFYDYEIWQMDVKTSFLNGYLDEDIYMASGSNVIFLILYVDDIIIMRNRIPSLQSVKDNLGKCFDMKDLGEAAFILGIKIYRDRSKRLIGLGQNAYMDKILKRYKMDNSKNGHIPMQESLDLNKTQGASTPKEVKRMQNVPYALAVGSIMYAVRCTRPDVVFAQNIKSQFKQNLGECHWTIVKNILKYLRNSKDMFLVYG
nr:retrotransposon protein, putative, Ty1-copia subclass [Tanacetum cinerariifolium]